MLDLESRFGHLLAPIRDLAANWHIDLASELEDYLHELDSITINIDQHTLQSLSIGAGVPSPAQSLNFAEAALLIQGSACVYSRKVEYLHALLYQTLDSLIDKSKRTTTNGNASDSAIDGDNDEFAEATMLSLDDWFEEGKNIDLDEEHVQDYNRARRSTLRPRLPLAITDTHTMPTTTGNNHSGRDGKKFRLSDCVVHSSGALLLESRDAAIMDSALGRSSVAVTGDAQFGHPVSVIQAHRQSLGLAVSSSRVDDIASVSGASQQLDFSDDGHEDFYDSGESSMTDAVSVTGATADRALLDSVFGPDVTTATSTTSISHTGPKSVKFAEDESLCQVREIERQSQLLRSAAALVDPFAVLDPFDSTSVVKPKPFRKGKSYQTLTDTDTDNYSRVALLPSMSPGVALVTAQIAKGAIKLPSNPEFAAMVLYRLEAMKTTMRNKKKREREVREYRTDTTSDSYDLGQPLRQTGAQPSERELDLPVFDDATEHEDFASFDSNPDTVEADAWADDTPLPSSEPSAEASLLASSLSLSSLLDSSCQSDDNSLLQPYEDMCRAYLDQYLRSADEFLHSSELTMRVRDWTTKLTPILEEEDARPAFDIHHYGDRVIDSVQSIATDSGIADGRGCVEFEAAVQGAPIYEICRLFLATLQLANNGNVEITNDADDSQSNGALSGWGSLALRVLNEERCKPVEALAAKGFGGSQSAHLQLDKDVVSLPANSAEAKDDESDSDGEEDRTTKREQKVRQRRAALTPIATNAASNASAASDKIRQGTRARARAGRAQA